MKKLLLVVIAFITVSVASAQKKKDWTKVTGRAGDHIMMQLSYDMMMGVADSVKDRMKGIPRGFNAYVMLDKVFKGSPVSAWLSAWVSAAAVSTLKNWAST
ncbi:MAG: hypothetical protein IPI66_03080 [Chitinophagaceae bacterium]|nr:hypothetical protein [Chitinophagaceae bacterium]